MDKTDLRIDNVKSAAPTVNSSQGGVEKSSSVSTSRPMQKGRFLFGMLLSASGLASMLIVAAGALQTAGMSGRLSLPAVALFMVLGLMLLGGGFGVMATSAGTFDDDEFNRLMAETAAERDTAKPQSRVSELPAFRNARSTDKKTVSNRSDQTVA